MIVYLAGVYGARQVKHFDKEFLNNLYMLCSYWDWRKAKILPEFLLSDRHILDSGAYSTFKDIQQAKTFDWDTYVKNYINFIKATDKKLFFELDIDSVVGLNKVEYYRNKITDAVGRQPVPVWHSNRGWEYYLKMVEEFPYVSIGTTSANADGKKIRKNPLVLKKFIDEAHLKGKKIHGLGFTNTDWLPKLNFDSVDSTSWISGKYGQICKFTGVGMISKKIPGKKLVGLTTDHHKHNLLEWYRYQLWALENL